MEDKSVASDLSAFHIDLEQLKRNWRWLDAKSAPHCRTASVVKANAYGHGMFATTQSLIDAGCNIFCVATMDEAIQLRRFLDSTDTDHSKLEIICFDGLQAYELDSYYQYQIIPALKQVSEIETARDYARKINRIFPVWLQLDTGMNRLGISAAELEIWLDSTIASYSGALDIKAVMSHLSCSDMPSHHANEHHRIRFLEMSKNTPSLPLSLSASHGILLNDAYHFDITRPGIALYGYQDSPNADFACQPILQWIAPILQIRSIKKGEQVGYGADFTADKQMRIATIGAGYADGYRRALQACGKINLGGNICKPVGRISMDSFVIDVTDISETDLNKTSQVCLLGTHYSASDMAFDLSTISYEVLTSLGTRPKRVYS